MSLMILGGRARSPDRSDHLEGGGLPAVREGARPRTRAWRPAGPDLVAQVGEELLFDRVAASAAPWAVRQGVRLFGEPGRWHDPDSCRLHLRVLRSELLARPASARDVPRDGGVEGGEPSAVRPARRSIWPRGARTSVVGAGAARRTAGTRTIWVRPAAEDARAARVGAKPRSAGPTPMSAPFGADERPQGSGATRAASQPSVTAAIRSSSTSPRCASARSCATTTRPRHVGMTSTASRTDRPPHPIISTAGAVHAALRGDDVRRDDGGRQRGPGRSAERGRRASPLCGTPIRAGVPSPTSSPRNRRGPRRGGPRPRPAPGRRSALRPHEAGAPGPTAGRGCASARACAASGRWRPERGAASRGPIGHAGPG